MHLDSGVSSNIRYHTPNGGMCRMVCVILPHGVSSTHHPPSFLRGEGRMV